MSKKPSEIEGLRSLFEKAQVAVEGEYDREAFAAALQEIERSPLFEEMTMMGAMSFGMLLALAYNDHPQELVREALRKYLEQGYLL